MQNSHTKNYNAKFAIATNVKLMLRNGYIPNGIQNKGERARYSIDFRKLNQKRGDIFCFENEKERKKKQRHLDVPIFHTHTHKMNKNQIKLLCEQIRKCGWH